MRSDTFASEPDFTDLVQADAAASHGHSLPLVIATILREEGITGVHTHIRQLRRCLEESNKTATLMTPFSWSRTLAVPAFGPRLILQRCSGTADVAWYRHWHEAFLRRALRSSLAEVGDCVVYAQCPLSARAALRARRGPEQRVVMAVHFSVSQADEWAVKNLIKRRNLVPSHPTSRTRNNPTGRRSRVRVALGAKWAAELATGSRSGAVVGHRQLRGAIAPCVQPKADRGSRHCRQSSSSEEPPFPAGCPCSGQEGRAIPHSRCVWRGAAPEGPPATSPLTRPGRAGRFPRFPPRRARLPAALPGLRPRFVL